MTKIKRKRSLATTSPVFKNQHGKIKVGTKVQFGVENQDDWNGDLEGVLIHESGEFKIKTARSGTLTIGKGYDAYWGTIKPVE
ncbi:MAG: hypothetical protein WC763_00700 [Candidatus Paceibacterota bacterium]|jgi:hypothetical protein